nr:HK97 family phage prohead protease [Rickettsia monacensis]
MADHHNDLISKGAFANASHHNVKFLWQHDSKKPIGIITHLVEVILLLDLGIMPIIKCRLQRVTLTIPLGQDVILTALNILIVMTAL